MNIVHHDMLIIITNITSPFLQHSPMKTCSKPLEPRMVLARSYIPNLSFYHIYVLSYICIIIFPNLKQNVMVWGQIQDEPGVIEVSSPVLPGASESSWWWNMIWLCYHYLSIYFIYHQIFIVKCCWWKKCCPWTVDQNSQKILWHNFIVSKIAKNISMAQFYGFPNSQTYFYNTILWFLFSFLFSTLTFLKQEIVRGVHYCRCQHLV